MGRTNAKWSKEEDEELMKLYKEIKPVGVTGREIVSIKLNEIFGNNRTAKAIKLRAHTLELAVPRQQKRELVSSEQKKILVRIVDENKYDNWNNIALLFHVQTGVKMQAYSLSRIYKKLGFEKPEASKGMLEKAPGGWRSYNDKLFVNKIGKWTKEDWYKYRFERFYTKISHKTISDTELNYYLAWGDVEIYRRVK